MSRGFANQYTSAIAGSVVSFSHPSDERTGAHGPEWGPRQQQEEERRKMKGAGVAITTAEPQEKKI